MFETFRALRGDLGARQRADASPHDAGFTRLTRVVALTLGGLALALALAACSAPRGVPGATSSTPPAAEVISTLAIAPPVALDLSTTSAWPEPYRSDPLWVRAGRGDTLDRYTLARREGAQGLMTALMLGGDLDRTALAALPSAPDRRDAGAELCRSISAARAPTRDWLLAALHELLVPTVAGLDPDPYAYAGCRETLLVMSRDATLGAREQDLTSSALVYLDPASTAAP